MNTDTEKEEITQTVEPEKNMETGGTPVLRTPAALPAGVVVNKVQSPRSKVQSPGEQIAGQFNLRNLKGTREDVLEQIRGAATVPESFKASLVELIETVHGRSRLIFVDAHCQVVRFPNGQVKTHGCWAVSEL